MREPDFSPDVERRINDHLEAIDRIMAAKGAPLRERRCVTDDVEAQIRDMLAGIGREPSLAEVGAVLGRLDAPESYAEGAEVFAVSAPHPAKEGLPRFTRVAIAAALFTPAVLCLGRRMIPAAVFGTVALGAWAVTRIGQSGGRLYGLPLAFAALLFYPVLILNVSLVWATSEGYAALGPEHTSHLTAARGALVTVVAVVGLGAQFLIIRWLWRKTSRPADGVGGIDRTGAGCSCGGCLGDTSVRRD